MSKAKNASRKMKFLGIELLILLTSIYFGFINESIAAELPVKTATHLSNPRAIAPFSLTSMQDQPLTNKDFKGHWTLMFFGFTHCQDICPTTLSELNKVDQILQSKKVTAPEVMLISVDPKRDTPAVIKNYVTGFNKNFKGATGTDAQLKNISQSLGVVYAKLENHADHNHYIIDHSGSILMINPEGKLAAVFTMPHQAAQIAEDFILISGHTN